MWKKYSDTTLYIEGLYNTVIFLITAHAHISANWVHLSCLYHMGAT